MLLHGASREAGADAWVGMVHVCGCEEDMQLRVFVKVGPTGAVSCATRSDIVVWGVAGALYREKRGLLAALHEAVQDSTAECVGIGLQEAEEGKGNWLEESNPGRDLGCVLARGEAAVGVYVRSTDTSVGRTWSMQFGIDGLRRCVREAERQGEVTPGSMSSVRPGCELPASLVRVVEKRRKWAVLCTFPGCMPCKEVWGALGTDVSVAEHLFVVAGHQEHLSGVWVSDPRGGLLREMEVAGAPLVILGSKHSVVDVLSGSASALSSKVPERLTALDGD